MSKANWEKVGMIGVDAGLCWLGDPCYCVTPDAVEHPAATWLEFCDRLGTRDEDGAKGVYPFAFKAGHLGLGVAVSTGYGDGCYPVFVKRNKEGRIAAVKVQFLANGEDE